MSRSTDQASGSIVDRVCRALALAGDSFALTWPNLWVSLFLLAVCATARSQERAPEVLQGRSQSMLTPTPPEEVIVETDASVLRTETMERLKAYEPATTTDTARTPGSQTTNAQSTSSSPLATGAGGAAAGLSPASTATSKKSLPSLLQERLRWLNEYDAAWAALQKATHPEPSPTQQLADAAAEIGRLRMIVSQSERAPDSLLPPLFQGQGKVSSALGSDMKDAIEATSSELKEWKTKLEALRSEITKSKSLMDARRSERDSLFQCVTALTAKSGEYKSAVTDALTSAERQLAHERLVNFEWELRVETLRLRLIEAQLALETKLAEVRERRAEMYRAHLEVASRTLEPMQARYRVVAEDQERDLTQAKTDEEKKARLSTDAFESFRARRAAELLALEALVLRNEQTLVIPPRPFYEEQKTLADRADFDFANIKELLDDGKVSRLDAIRLNNEFRRIGPERDGLLKSEMSLVEAQLQFYENTLTSVELELLQTSSHYRFERDLMRERLSPARWADAESMIRGLEAKHRQLLSRRRRALEKLSEATSHTHVQVTRRLGILEQEYGFIRTTIFWVRDQEPIGLLTLTQGAREFNVMVKGLLGLVQETLKPSLWGQPSGEFVVTAVAALVCPIALIRLRRVLGKQFKRDLPVPHE
jgi:hypothetical protein